MKSYQTHLFCSTCMISVQLILIRTIVVAKWCLLLLFACVMYKLKFWSLYTKFASGWMIVWTSRNEFIHPSFGMTTNKKSKIIATFKKRLREWNYSANGILTYKRKKIFKKYCNSFVNDKILKKWTKSPILFNCIWLNVSFAMRVMPFNGVIIDFILDFHLFI